MMSDLEVRRRLFHLVNGFIFTGLIYYNIVNWWIAGLIFLFCLGLGLIVKRYDVPFAFWFFEKFDRPKDFETLPGKGSIFYMLGITLVLLLSEKVFFDKNIAIASILILAIGDSMAAIIGQYGKIQHPFNSKKYMEGVIGGGILAAIAAAMFVSPLEAILATVAAMILEGIDLKLGVNQLDDNLSMPLVAGLVIWLLRII